MTEQSLSILYIHPMSDGMGRELAYLSSHATNRYFIQNWGNLCKFSRSCKKTQDENSFVCLFFIKFAEDFSLQRITD